MVLCPLYLPTGIAGGSYYEGQGGNANRLCLSNQPEFDGTVINGDFYGSIYGSEYQYISDEDNYDVPCALCEVDEDITAMIPGTKTCPTGWTVQYTGHLTGNRHNHQGSAEYLCMDRDPEAFGAVSDQNGAVFTYVVAKCGSLPCPPYIPDRVVTCVVCSK